MVSVLAVSKGMGDVKRMVDGLRIGTIIIHYFRMKNEYYLLFQV